MARVNDKKDKKQKNSIKIKNKFTFLNSFYFKYPGIQKNVRFLIITEH